jgi:uncharacterized protein (TIGR02217 family)
MFIEELFPLTLAKKIVGGLEFHTTTINNLSGVENRNINWPLPKNRYNISKNLYSSKDIEIIQTWFRVTRGKAIGFRFRDALDYSGQKELIGIGNNQQSSFQLKKFYNIGKYNFVRKIIKPTIGSVKIYIDEQLTEADINIKNGLISLPTPPKDKQEIRADFQFDIPVRFNSDLLQTSYHSFNLYRIEQLELVEILL